MGQLEIKHLKLIASIAETGNMTKAADKLFISQSALSQQLKDVEGRLNVDLFFRTRRKMILTSFGKQLLQTAEKVIGILDDAELELAKQVSGESGEFRVGTQCIFCYKWLPRALSAFQEKFPNIEFELGASTDTQRELEEKKYDVIITGAGMNREDEPFSVIPLFQDQIVCIMDGGNPLSTRPFVRLEDFRNQCLISHSEKKENKFYQIVLKPTGVEPRKFMVIAQAQAIIDMVSSGFGISCLPGWAVEAMLDANGIMALPITRKGFPVEWNAVSLKKNDIPVYQKEFLSIVGRMNPMNQARA
ncbi:MAG: LysR family transcriptional regulator [Pseudomonadota bacterium]